MAPRKNTSTRSASKRTAVAKAANHDAPATAIIGEPAANGGNGYSLMAVHNPSVSEEQIRMRAYEIYLARGGAHGYDLADWLRAEMELSGFRTH